MIVTFYKPTNDSSLWEIISYYFTSQAIPKLKGKK
jgi:hypothetical protein